MTIWVGQKFSAINLRSTKVESYHLGGAKIKLNDKIISCVKFVFSTVFLLQNIFTARYFHKLGSKPGNACNHTKKMELEFTVECDFPISVLVLHLFRVGNIARSDITRISLQVFNEKGNDRNASEILNL